MLKIKDNVDLEVLEKYGFVKGFNHEGVASIYITKDRLVIITNPNCCWWNMDYYYNYGSETSIIYDLIKDGLVEKV